MKLNLANPSTGLQKIVEVDDEKKLLPFFEKRMGHEVTCDNIGDEFQGYVFRISGGNDKQGFPMMQGVLANHRVRLLFKKGMKCFRPRRDGQKRRKSIRGCIVGPDLAVLNLVLVKKGSDEIPGLTDGEKPRRLGPKRASRIRKLFNLTKEDDVRQYVIRRKVETASGKTRSKAPKIQRLITNTRLQRKRRLRNLKIRAVENTKREAEEYKIMVDKYHHDKLAATHKKDGSPRASNAGGGGKGLAAIGSKPGPASKQGDKKKTPTAAVGGDKKGKDATKKTTAAAPGGGGKKGGGGAKAVESKGKKTVKK
eukprot:GHVQ01004885.1.p1 GENE.GHVQ01004885.1~~GHVQ01004885.1.p1  ORF type:complete len:310 (+),score=72.02 GHVQ01004885.1:213-1142(+)